MEIIINDEKVEYTIENEQSLGDVLTSLEGWIAENGGVIDSVSVDETEIIVGQQTDQLNKNISSVGRLSLHTASRFDHAIGAIATVSEYIDRIVGTYLKSRDIDDYELILEGINLIYEAIACSLNTLHVRPMVVINDRGKSLAEILLEVSSLIELFEKQYVDGEGRKELSDVLTELQQLLPKMVNWALLKNSFYDSEVKGLEVSFLKTALVDLENIAVKTIEKFERIGENLQVGRDSEALSDLLFVTEIMDEIIFVLQFFMTAYSMDSTVLSKSDLSMDELFEKFSAGLKEIENSFRSEDLITVGDMLEYEIMPLFGDIINLIRRVRVFIQ
jgi:hypothetical protein